MVSAPMLSADGENRRSGVVRGDTLDLAVPEFLEIEIRAAEIEYTGPALGRKRRFTI